MQTKLHRWAAGIPARRFDDLFNLVYDPAFLVRGVGTRRRQHRGADTGDRPGHGGLDRVPVGVEVFLHDIRAQLKSAHVPAGTGAAGDDPQGERQAAQAGYPDRHRPGRAGRAEVGAGTRSSRPTSSRAPTGSARTGARRTRSPRSTTSPRSGTSGCWRPTSRRVSTRSTTPR